MTNTCKLILINPAIRKKLNPAIIINFRRKKNSYRPNEKNHSWTHTRYILVGDKDSSSMTLAHKTEKRAYI